MSRQQHTFEVESIIDYRLQSGRQLFKIRWKGYQEKDCTWQPIKNLHNCMDLVRDFKIQKGIVYKATPIRKAKPYKVKRVESESQFSQKDDFEGKTNNQEQKNQNNQGKRDNQQDLNSANQQRILGSNKCQQYIREAQSPQPEFTILKMLKDSKNAIFFKVLTKKGIQRMSRCQIYKIDVRLLLNFYEKHINFKKRPQK